MAIVCGRGIASALAGLLLAATEMAQRTAATESNPGVFLGGSNPAMYEGHGAAQDNSGTPLSYDVQTIRFSGTVLIEFSLNTAVGCKEACEENLGLGNIGVTLIGFSWYDDTLYVDGSANGTGDTAPFRRRHWKSVNRGRSTTILHTLATGDGCKLASPDT